MEDIISTASQKRIAVVTGANKGIGLEICRQLASKGVVVVLTARDEKRGTEAVNKLKESGVSNVVFHQLDVVDPAGIASLADFIKTHFGRLDILVNNAGVGGVILDHKALGGAPPLGGLERDLMLKALQETYQKAEECISINYNGTRKVTEALIPLLQSSTSPRIVMVSSTYGKLRHISNEGINRVLNDVDTLTEERLDEIWKIFLKHFHENELNENGWPTTFSAYKLSKVLVSA